MHQLSISDVSCLLHAPGKLQKAKKVRSYFCLLDRRSSRHFFKLGRLARSKNLRMLITFIRSEARKFLLCKGHHSRLQTLAFL